MQRHERREGGGEEKTVTLITSRHKTVPVTVQTRVSAQHAFKVNVPIRPDAYLVGREAIRRGLGLLLIHRLNKTVENIACTGIACTGAWLQKKAA
jgi:hypothetical protein